MGSVRVDVARSRDVGQVVHRPFQPAGAPLASAWASATRRPWESLRATADAPTRKRGVTA